MTLFSFKMEPLELTALAIALLLIIYGVLRIYKKKRR